MKLDNHLQTIKSSESDGESSSENNSSKSVTD